MLNNVQKEVVNKAKYEEAREPKDIMAEFFMSNANKAQAEISTSKKEAEKLGINNITPSVSNEFGDDGTIDAIYNAALQAYFKKLSFVAVTHFVKYFLSYRYGCSSCFWSCSFQPFFNYFLNL